MRKKVVKKRKRYEKDRLRRMISDNFDIMKMIKKDRWINIGRKKIVDKF